MIDKTVEDIRQGKIDINNQQNIFATLLRGLLINLGQEITIRNLPVPHYILHTGDDVMYLENKNQNYSASEFDVTNENYVYSVIPRCNVQPGGIDLITDQLTSNNIVGQFQFDSGSEIRCLEAEFRRIPFKMGVELTYYTDTFTDKLELMQQIITKMAFIRTYKIVYMGQVINCSYKIPESMQGEWMMDMDGSTSDNRAKKVTLSLEVESNLPVWEPRTVMNPTIRVSDNTGNINAHATNHLKNEGPVIPFEKIPWKKS